MRKIEASDQEQTAFNDDDLSDVDRDDDEWMIFVLPSYPKVKLPNTTPPTINTENDGQERELPMGKDDRTINEKQSVKRPLETNMKDQELKGLRMRTKERSDQQEIDSSNAFNNDDLSDVDRDANELKRVHTMKRAAKRQVKLNKKKHKQKYPRDLKPKVNFIFNAYIYIIYIPPAL